MSRLVILAALSLFPLAAWAQPSYFGGWLYNIFDGYPPDVVAQVNAHIDVANEANLYLTNCSFFKGDDQIDCMANQAHFVLDYVGAIYNDHNSQDNVASALSVNQSVPEFGIVTNDVQSCAWRLAILDAGGPSVSTIDITSMQEECSNQSLDAQKLAQVRGVVIAKEIQIHCLRGDTPYAIINRVMY